MLSLQLFPDKHFFFSFLVAYLHWVEPLDLSVLQTAHAFVKLNA